MEKKDEQIEDNVQVQNPENDKKAFPVFKAPAKAVFGGKEIPMPQSA